MKITINGINFQLTEKDFYMANRHYGEVLNLTVVGTGKIIRQYIKNRYPEVVASVKTSKFAGGTSVGVYVSNPDGTTIPADQYTDIREFSESFEYGKFNGMIDMYEWNDEPGVTDNGVKIEGGGKYISVNNHPRFDSLPEIIMRLKHHMEEDGMSLQEAKETLHHWRGDNSQSYLRKLEKAEKFILGK